MKIAQIQNQQEVNSISFFQLFTFADAKIKFYIVLGTLAAIVNGITQPLFYFIQGQMYGVFSIQNKQIILSEIIKSLIYMILIGIAAFVSSWLMYTCWIVAGQRQTILCKKAYLKAILSQQIGWFDVKNQTELSSMFFKSTTAFSEAIGEKIPPLISIFSTLTTQILIGIILGWQLGLVILSFFPLYYFTVVLYGKFRTQQNQIKLTCYKQVDGKSQEILSIIKTVKSINGQEYELNKYKDVLKKIQYTIIKFSIWAALATASISLVFYLGNTLAYWYGNQLLVTHTYVYGHPYTIGSIFSIIMVVLSANQMIIQVEPAIKKIYSGKNQAIEIFKILRRVPLIDKNENGIKLNDNEFKGVIKFQNVKFAYPKQPHKIILQNLSFELLPNQRVAFVGQSGSGKSTITQLIMRFYDPLEGKITLDGIELNKFNLHWLRSKIGYVSQQPVLFACSIKQNLLMAKPDATQSQIITALIRANAYDFTMELSNKLDTFVGEGGTQLSGGQKQRIAIARALLKNGKIIMFDQATSALDMNNQLLIQQTLQKITGMTTINVAHRVNTIKNSDVIFVIAEGRVIESGKFNELKKFKNVNFQNLNSQQNNQPKQQKSPKIVIVEKQKIIKPNIQQDDEQLNKKYQGIGFFYRLATYNKKDIILFIIGIITAIFHAVLMIFCNFFNGYIISAIIQHQLNPSKNSRVNHLCLIFLICVITSYIFNCIKTSIFWVLSEDLLYQIRVNTFKKLLNMPIWWYDNPKSRNRLNKLPVSYLRLNQLTSQFVPISVLMVTTLLFSVSLAMYYDWRLALISIAFLPMLALPSLIQNKFLHLANTQILRKQKNNLVSEGFLNIRTLYSINGQESIIESYTTQLNDIYPFLVKRSHIVGIIYGISVCLLYISTGILFYISTIFIKQRNLSILESIISRTSVISAAFLIGTCFRFLPDFLGGKLAAANIFQTLDQEDEEQIQIKQNSRKLEQGYYKGDIEIKNLNFKYPQRNTEIFKNFNMKIQGGSKVAFVGESGAGKSTILQILLRFYEPESGEILIDGINIKDFEMHYLRSLFGVVSQQPVLFNTSFKQNIQYNKYDATQQDIIMAAKSAQAYNFIEGNEQLEGEDVKEQGDSILSKGFDRNVGLKGSHISGGQKQRVAIARTVLRKPKMVLLDEATSALDKTNQKLVQSALDKLMVNKTSITVAHRLDTIRNSNKIMVIKAGKIVEEGTYNELIASKGQLYKLQRGVFLNYIE